jgi:superoxide reductase
MAKRTEIYVCELCGNIVEVLDGAAGTLVCCGQDMVLLKANTVNAAQEKHVPEITLSGNTAAVQVGSVPHPMTTDHFIAWIELQQGDKIQRAYLKPDGAPQTAFTIETGIPITVRAYCNLHGLWKAGG